MLRAVVHADATLSVPLDVVDNVERAVLDALGFHWAPPDGRLNGQIDAGLANHRSAD